MASMIYPGNGSVVKIETFFVEGTKFDVCEVAESHYEYLSPQHPKAAMKPSARYFLAVDDVHVVNYALAEKYHALTGECRYDFFCMGRNECLARIKDFEKRALKIERMKNSKTCEAKASLARLIESTNALFGSNFC